MWEELSLTLLVESKGDSKQCAHATSYILGMRGTLNPSINFRSFADRYRLKPGLILEWKNKDKNCVIKKTLAVARFHEKLEF